MARGILATYFYVKEIFMRIFKDSFRIIMRSKSILISMILFYLFIIWAAINPSNTTMLAAKPLGNAMTLSFYFFLSFFIYLFIIYFSFVLSLFILFYFNFFFVYLFERFSRIHSNINILKSFN